MGAIAKTETTIQLERNIWTTTDKMGTFGCFEVTIGWLGYERVDYITYDTKGTWRCYEIKVSKSDFYSKAKKTFVGHYNYFVLPSELYEEVKHDIPSHIGVYVDGKYSKKRARKQGLTVDEQILKDSMIRSLFRESSKQYKSDNPTVVENMDRMYKRVKKERDEYYHKYWNLMRIGQEKYGNRWYVKEDSNDKV